MEIDVFNVKTLPRHPSDVPRWPFGLHFCPYVGRFSLNNVRIAFSSRKVAPQVGKRPVTRRRRPQSGRFPSFGPCETIIHRNVVHSKNVTFDFFEISRTSVRKVQGMAHASAADPCARPLWKILVPALGRPKIDQNSIKNLINFRYRFWIDLGSFWDPNLASFSAFLAPKFGQVRSKTRLESWSTLKT